MRKIPIPVIGLTVILVTIGLWAGHQALAAPSEVTFNVTSTVDDIDDNVGNGYCHTPTAGPAAGACTLRAAIMEANVTTGPGVTIIVPSGTYTLTRPPAGANGPDSGDLNLTAPPNGSDTPISIIGAGADSTFVDANYLDRVLVVANLRRASISGLTIRHGLLPSGSGGGIYNAGTLTLTQVILTANQAQYGGGITNSSGTLVLIRSTLNANLAGYGAGIYNPSGTLSVVQSTISGNTATYYGGGIYNSSSQLATVIQSTLNANGANSTSLNADGGGGIYNYNSTSLVLVNSTLSQNSANNNGGGIWNSGVANLYSSSVVFNMADADADANGGNGGGIWNSGSFSIRHTLVAGNTSTEPQAGFDDCSGTLNANGWNLFSVVDSLICTINTYNSTWGTLSSLAVIGPLQNNGGPTLTHALKASSNPIGNPIDAGGLPAACIDNDSLPLTTDQRGAARSVDGDGDGVARCDIGAYEYQPPLYLPLIRR